MKKQGVRHMILTAVLVDVLCLLEVAIGLGAAAAIHWVWHRAMPESTTTVWQIWITLVSLALLRYKVSEIMT